MEGFTLVDGVWVENKIFSTYFSCDYEKCKGACCWLDIDENLDGGILLPIEKWEIQSKKDILAVYCRPEYKELACKNPTYRSGRYFCTTLAKDGSCIYSDRVHNTCVCRLAHADGKLSFAIPNICQMYPLWVRKSREGTILELLNTFEKQCMPAFEKGKREHIKVYQSCKIPIIRFFGKSFYDKLEKVDR